MQVFEADIIQVNRKGNFYFYATMVVLAVTTVILMVTGILPFLAQLAWIGFFGYQAVRYYMQTRKKLLKRPVGKLVISEERIEVCGIQSFISELKVIRLAITGWRSYLATGDRSMPVSDFHAGDRNFISFSSGLIEKYEFLLESELHFQQLREHVISWYRSGINVIETTCNMKSYGLQVLGYAQIQEFKKQISTPTAK
ncbi:MAG TPA: hypothetical protein VF145_00850 [Chitinophagaceae bacterium]